MISDCMQSNVKYLDCLFSKTMLTAPYCSFFTHAFICLLDLPHFIHIVFPAHHSIKNYRSLENLVSHWQEKPIMSAWKVGWSENDGVKVGALFYYYF